jgi:hypothetical protein
LTKTSVELGHLVRVEPGHVLDQRGFQGRRVVARGHDGARQGLDLSGLLGDRPGREVAPPSGDDLEGLAVAVGAHEQGHEHAPRLDARQDVGDVRGLPAVAHVDGGNLQLADLDMSKLHGPILRCWG